MSLADLDRSRVQLLLKINNLLLLRWAGGVGGDEAQHLMRRTHLNLQCLGSINERYTKGTARGVGFPLILVAPPGGGELEGMYAELRRLFPEGVQAISEQQARRQGQAQAQMPGQMQAQMPGQMPGQMGMQRPGAQLGNPDGMDFVNW